MADDLNVDLGIGTNDLEASLRRTFEVLQNGLQTAQQVQTWFERTARAAREMPAAVADLDAKLKAAKGTAGEVGLTRQLEDAKKRQQELNRELEREITLQRELSLARGAGQRTTEGNRVADGRTIAEVRLTERAVSDAITGINTTADQIAARLSIATGKAMERLIAGTAQQVEQSVQLAANRAMSRNAQFSVPGYLDASVVNARVAAEAAVRKAGTGSTLEERDAFAANEKLKRTAELEAASEAKRAALREYYAAVDENRRRDIVNRDLARGIEAENKRAAVREYNAAQYENAQRDRQKRADELAAASEQKRAALREYYEAQDANRRFDKNRKGLASAEQARLDPLTAAREQTKDESFANRYGVARSEFAARIVQENLTIEQQRALLAALRRERQDAMNAGRPAPLTAQDRARQSFENRSAAFDLNGGADQLAFQTKLVANYAIMGGLIAGFRSATTAVIEFDEQLKQFQAITGTADAEMDGFRTRLLDVATQSKFSVSELTQVAVALGQTGLSARGVADALKPVVDLAAASGSTLQQSVEAITGVLGAYTMDASRAADVADVFVAALNRTKLTMDQLQLGIQYAANIARDSGVSFSELTASIGAVAQAGVKSGSTIGTGIRQLITEFTEPTDKLRGVLKELGINLADVDLRTQGFSGVLQNLAKGGFTTADALRSMDLRAASAFASLLGQTSKIDELQQEFLLTSAATEASSKANESLSASGQRLINVLFNLTDTALHPLVTMLASAAGGTATLLSNFTALGPVLALITAGLASVAAAAAAIKIGNLIQGLATIGGGLIAGALPLAGGILAAGTIGYFLTQIQTEAEKARVKLDALKAVENDLTSRRDSLQTVGNSLDSQITTLINRREKLNSDPILARNAIIEAQKAFGDLGLAVDPATTSIDQLIDSLKKLRGEMSQEMPVLLAQQLSAVTAQIEQLRKLEADREGRNRTQQVSLPGGEFSGLDGGTVGVDPLAQIRALGPEFNAAADVLTGKVKLDPENARGSSAITANQMAGTLRTLAQSRTAVALSDAYTDDEKKVISDRLNAQIDLVEKAIKMFADRVAAVSNEQALNLRRTQLERESQVAAIQASPQFNEIKNARDAIYGAQDEAIQAAQRDTRGFAGYQAMQAAARSTDELVRDQLAKVEEAKAAAIRDGATPEAAKEAYDKVIDSFKTLLQGSTKEIRDRFKSASGDAKADLNAQIRNATSQMELLQRQASTTADPGQVTELQGLATHYQEVINTARERLFNIELGPNADQVLANSPELQDKQRELQEKGAADLNKLAVSYAELHRRVQVQMLTFQADRATERRDLLQEQIKGLEKVRDDARSTPEQMRAAVQEINRLLGEVARIGQTINRINADKVDTKLPTTLGPTVSFDRGSTQQAIVDQLRAAGASEDRIRYALGAGQIESGYSPDVISGARRSSAGAAGLFQFMPSTWQKMYGTRDVDTDIAAQIRAFQEFTDRNAGTFRSNMGREATPEELYLMHQQGAAGSMALLRAGSGSALDALTSVYGGDVSKARSAITGNGGRADMTADELVELIERKFRAASAKVGDPFGTTGDAEAKRMRVVADDKTAAEAERLKAENERKAQANERARELAELKRTDKALSETYDTQLEAVRKAQDPAAALSASRDAYATLKQLLDTAKKEDANKPGLDDDARAGQADATRKRFAGLFQQQGLTTAETIGKDSLKAYEDRLTQLRAEQKELERPENEGRAGNTDRLNVLRDEINQLEKQKELQGTYEANQAKIVALEETLKQMKDAGLDVDRDGVEVQRRILELRERNKVLEPTMNLSRQQAGTQRTYGEAASGAMDSFLKSRGVLDFKGQVVDPVVQAQKTLQESLGVIGGAFDNFFTNLFSGSMKAGDALKAFATSILSGLMSQISKSLTNSIFQSLFTSGSGSGGGIIDGLSSLFRGALYSGGPVRFAAGGVIPGSDAALSMRDSRTILAQPGEYLLRRSAVDAIGREQLDQVNALGGAMVNRAPKVDAGQKFGGASAAANVYVVDREQVPPPSANDVVHMIGDNIQRGGAIRQLIKSVAARG